MMFTRWLTGKRGTLWKLARCFPNSNPALRQLPIPGPAVTATHLIKGDKMFLREPKYNNFWNELR